MKLLSGQVYSNVTVLSYDRAGYAIRHTDGNELVPYGDVAAELRGHYKALSLVPVPPSRLAQTKYSRPQAADQYQLSRFYAQ